MHKTLSGLWMLANSGSRYVMSRLLHRGSLAVEKHHSEGIIITKNGLKPVDSLPRSCQRRVWVMVKRNEGEKMAELHRRIQIHEPRKLCMHG
jgi:hypothetical protein